MSERSSLLLGLAASSTLDDVLGDEGLKRWHNLNQQIIANAHLFNEEEFLNNTISLSKRLYAEINRQINLTEDRQLLDDQDIQATYKKLKSNVQQIPVTNEGYASVISQLSL